MKIEILVAEYSAALIAGLTIASSPLSARTANVTDSGDSGAGTFRAAVEEATADESISIILFSPNLGTVALQSSVTYSSGQSLVINGEGAVIEPVVKEASISSQVTAVAISALGQ